VARKTCNVRYRYDRANLFFGVFMLDNGDYSFDDGDNDDYYYDEDGVGFDDDDDDVVAESFDDDDGVAEGFEVTGNWSGEIIVQPQFDAPDV
jgi:hypothetical protein